MGWQWERLDRESSPTWADLLLPLLSGHLDLSTPIDIACDVDEVLLDV